MARHQLDPEPGTVAGVFSAAHEPVLTIDPGDTIVVGSLDAAGCLEPMTAPGAETPQLIPGLRGHCLTGPVAIRGAGPGGMIALHLDDLTPGDWGWTAAGSLDTPVNHRLGLAGQPASWLLWNLDVRSRTGSTSEHGFRRKLAPFLGVMGVAPAEPGEHSTIPPRPGTGGNIDCRELTAGSTLYLPVEVAGARLYLGDGHAAQGDGEAGGTAIECPMTTTARVDLAPDRPLASIHAEAPAGRITFGFSSDLNAAMGDALDAMVTWLTVLTGADRGTALALAGVSVDLRVTQVVNQTWGVHAVLPAGALD